MLRTIGAARFTCVVADVCERKKESLFHSPLVLNSIRGKFIVLFVGEFMGE